MSVKENLFRINDEIANAAKKSCRKIDEINLLAVSKFHPVAKIEEAIKAGHFLFGENRVQEASEKFSSLQKKYPNARLHIIGTLQKNKVLKAVQISSCIESVTSLSLLQEIEKQCAKINKKIDILFEYKTGEESKLGFTTLEELYTVLDFCTKGNTPHIVVKGFMTMAPFTTEEKILRKAFQTMREISEKAKKDFSSLSLNVLSMGMSNDFKIAIEEGSTEVRIGTSIFGERKY